MGKSPQVGAPYSLSMNKREDTITTRYFSKSINQTRQ